MSIQSEWQPASRKKPAEFDLDYVDIKVQVCADDTTGEMQVRLATEFNADWMEGEFEQWCADMGDEEPIGVFEALYPMLKNLVANMANRDKRALLNAAINELEQCNPGLIRG